MLEGEARRFANPQDERAMAASSDTAEIDDRAAENVAASGPADAPAADNGITADIAEPAAGPNMGAVAASAVVEDAQPRPPERRKIKSIKLDRTLAELENAFDSWNSVVPGKKPPRQAIAPGEPAPLVPSPEEMEFKQRTKTLLSQLREQLSELSDA
jgi:hypothetical protein